MVDPIGGKSKSNTDLILILQIGSWIIAPHLSPAMRSRFAGPKLYGHSWRCTFRRAVQTHGGGEKNITATSGMLCHRCQLDQKEKDGS